MRWGWHTVGIGIRHLEYDRVVVLAIGCCLTDEACMRGRSGVATRFPISSVRIGRIESNDENLRVTSDDQLGTTATSADTLTHRAIIAFHDHPLATTDMRANRSCLLYTSDAADD